MRRESIAGMLVAVAALALVSCSSGKQTQSVNVSPGNGLTDQPLNVAVTANFSNGITEPPVWLDAFTLKKNGTGDTLCTLVTYDGNSHIATCAHDPLEASTSYQIIVNEIIAVTSVVSTFSTGTALAEVLGEEAAEVDVDTAKDAGVEEGEATDVDARAEVVAEEGGEQELQAENTEAEETAEN